MSYRAFFRLALPIICQQIISLSIGFIDVLMISRLGPQVIAAGGICNQINLVYYLIGTGIAAGMTVFVAQYWGNRDLPGIKRMLGIALSGAIICQTVLGALFLWQADGILQLIAGKKDPAVITYGLDYMRIVIFSFLPQAITTCFSFAMRAIGKPKPALVLSIFAVPCNAVLNYVFIFGKLGFPALGIGGAALATTITKVLEMVCLVLYVYRREKVLAASLKELFDFKWPLVKASIKVALPVIYGDVLWAVAMVCYVSAFSRISTDAMAAVQVTNSIGNLFYAVIISISATAAVLIGNMIGEGRQKEVQTYSRKCIHLSLWAGAAVGVALIVTYPLTIRFFNVEEQLVKYVIGLLLVQGLCMPMRAACSMLIVGILRGGGDTTFAFWSETFTMWVIGMPSAFLGAIVLGWEIHWVVLLTYVEVLVKAVICYCRFRRGHWLHNLTGSSVAAS